MLRWVNGCAAARSTKTAGMAAVSNNTIATNIYEVFCDVFSAFFMFVFGSGGLHNPGLRYWFVNIATFNIEVKQCN